MKTFRLATLLVAVLLCALAACSDQKPAPEIPPTTFVLVHGAWQAPYVWQPVQQRLEQQHHKVIVVELPGHGSDLTPPQALTLNAYRDKVVAAIRAQPNNVVLVGHSLGGMVVTAVAESIPARITKLVYVGAFLPANGQSLLALAATDSTSQLGAALVPSADQLTLDIRPDRLVPVFIQDGSPAAQQLVAGNYRAEPAIPFTNPVTVTAANFGRVDKYYVHTALDNAVGLRLQQRMAAAAGIAKTYTLRSSHCPFLAVPDQLSEVLLALAR
ncbi:alpha/beta fold hydrolase [Hymenobacter ruricola]|uniref:Alpha/beta fold hydrolase n=1 Tax=Hymenobacter ruricola TaxID=2791023 RepID=A0ABS0I2W9_9BACT|nr:alpha/beta fold hydrolase [Hymenobacter ruricola]MBF9221290.1 alpha/beta fold hydrolase [Hymenobacter ruricola]